MPDDPTDYPDLHCGEPDPLELGELRQAVQLMANPPDGPLGRLVDFGELLFQGNQRVRLTGAKHWDALLRPHLLDCTLAAQFVPQDARTILDWGSGGGLPGLVWAILFPDKRFMLAERNRKKASFLEEAAVMLDLTNVEVLCGQAEETLVHQDRPDLLTARAVEPLPKLLRRIRRHKVKFGSLFWMGGSKWEETWEEVSEWDRSSWVRPAHHPYSLGELGERSVVVFKPR